MCLKDADGMANGEEPKQTAPRTVCSVSALFAQTYLSLRIFTVSSGRAIALAGASALYEMKPVTQKTLKSGFFLTK